MQHAVYACWRYIVQFLAYFYAMLRMIAYYPSSLQRSLAMSILLKAASDTGVSKIICFFIFVEEPQMHDREIILRNARMPIYFDANLYAIQEACTIA